MLYPPVLSLRSTVYVALPLCHVLDHVVFQDVLYAHVHASLFLVLYALALHVHVDLDNAFSLLVLCAVLQDDLGVHVLNVLYLVLHVLHEPVVPDAYVPTQHVDVVVHYE